MGHPSVHEVLDPPNDGVREHVAQCASCRALAGLADRAPASEARIVPVVIDPAMYEGKLEIHRGGMGRMFRARDRRLDREVAIKEMLEPEAVADPWLRARFRARFEREAMLTARLQHPAIVAIYEAGKWSDGEPFYAMPLIRGTPLDREIERRPTLARRLELLGSLVTVCDAIAYAHEQGIVHRDVKPQNILVGTFGETVLIDWGLARDRLRPRDEDAEGGERRDGLTQMGIGTPAYMPPEQARGEDPDERADIYALGATLYHLIAGTPPYGGRKIDSVREMLLREPPRPLAEVAPDAPADLRDVVARAMARDRTGRFASALDLADELRRIQSGQLVRSRRYHLGELIAHWVRRHRAPVAVGVIALVVVIVLTIIGVRQIIGERDRATENAALATRESARSRGVTASLLSTRPDRRLEALREAVAAVSIDAPPAEATRGLFDAVSTGAVQRVLLAGNAQSGAFDHAGNRIVVGDTSGALRWFDANGVELARTPTALTHVWLLWSPDDRWVAAWKEGLELWDAGTRTSRVLDKPSEDWLLAAAWSADHLITGDYKGNARRWDAASGKLLATLALGSPVSAAAGHTDRAAIGLGDGSIVIWHRDGRQARLKLPGEVAGMGFLADGTLVATTVDGNVQIWPLDAQQDARDGTPVASANAAVNRLWAAGTTIVAQRRGRDLMVFDVRTPETIHLVPSQLADATLIDPAGKRVMAASEDGVLRVLDTTTGDVIARMIGQRTITGSLSPKGDRLLAVGQGVAALWDARGGFAAGIAAIHASEVTAIDQAGDTLAIAAYDGRVHLVDVRSGGVVLAKLDVELVAVKLLPDGGAVAAGLERAIVIGADGKPRATLAGQDGISTLATAGDTILIGALDGSAWLWNATGIRRPLAVTAPITAVALSPDGKRAATGDQQGELIVWDVASGAKLATRQLPKADVGGVLAIAFSRDGEWLAAANTDRTELYRGAQHAEAGSRPGRPLGNPFTPASDRIATALPDGRIAISKLSETGSSFFERHAGAILAFAWSADGTSFVTGGDGALRWSALDGTTIRLVQRTGPVTAVALTPDGRWLIGAANGMVRADPTSAVDARSRACTTLAQFGEPCAPDVP